MAHDDDAFMGEEEDILESGLLDGELEDEDDFDEDDFDMFDDEDDETKEDEEEDETGYGYTEADYMGYAERDDV